MFAREKDVEDGPVSLTSWAPSNSIQGPVKGNDLLRTKILFVQDPIRGIGCREGDRISEKAAREEKRSYENEEKERLTLKYKREINNDSVSVPVFFLPRA